MQSESEWVASFLGESRGELFDARGGFVDGAQISDEGKELGTWSREQGEQKYHFYLRSFFSSELLVLVMMIPSDQHVSINVDILR